MVLLVSRYNNTAVGMLAFVSILFFLREKDFATFQSFAIIITVLLLLVFVTTVAVIHDYYYWYQ